MTEEAKEARRAYRREWARKNRDKVRAQEEKFWERRAAAMAAQPGHAEDVNGIDEANSNQ